MVLDSQTSRAQRSRSRSPEFVVGIHSDTEASATSKLEESVDPIACNAADMHASALEIIDALENIGIVASSYVERLSKLPTNYTRELVEAINHILIDVAMQSSRLHGMAVSRKPDWTTFETDFAIVTDILQRIADLKQLVNHVAPVEVHELASSVSLAAR